ncbi:MAG: ATP cone domain-containing protein, partial [Minisyncoccia bacterium]
PLYTTVTVCMRKVLSQTFLVTIKQVRMTPESALRAAASSLTVKDSENARYQKFVPKIRKRDGRVVPLEFGRVANAIFKAMVASQEGSDEEAIMVAHKVVSDLVRTARKHKDFVPTVEGIQDEVERQLILSDYVTASKAYILYRAERARKRSEEVVEIPESLKKLVAESKSYFKGNALGEFVFLRSYARWKEDEQRRETWVESVDRYMAFMKENLGKKLEEKEYAEVRMAILKQQVMPSMRAMQFSGDPARRCNVCVYNCSFIAPQALGDFAEIMYLSMCGTGVGFSVESENIQQLPLIARQSKEKLPTHVVVDSKEGWCDALTHGLKTWFAGKDVDFDYSMVRPAGARLKVMGGKSSGPEPLRSLLGFARNTIISRQGKRLTNINAHDIICKIGECVVAGGVRRSAMISLSDLDDDAMRDAKKGQFFLTDMHRSISNNSAVYQEKPTTEQFLDEWMALVKSKSGERGIFNRGSLKTTLPQRRLNLLNKKFKGDIGQLGTNPCGEIILQSKQFCNLSEVIARAEDTEATLLKKIKIATILGTYQSSLTNFKYLSKEWIENADAERLLGVSITGQWDCPAVRHADVLKKLRDTAVKTNAVYAKRFGINPSTAITAVKPSGTVSKTFDTASGMHARFAPYYIQRIRISATDSLFKMLRDQGVPYNPEVGQTMETANTYVIDFAVKAPENAVFKKDLSAIDQLEYWKVVKVNYTEHNPSITVSVGDDEWIAVANWVYQNWEIVGGLSFLPRTDFVYRLAPMEECTKEQYEELAKKYEKIDYSQIVVYEKKDNTDVKKELACAGGTCEIEL